jgi:hypothetical protein
MLDVLVATLPPRLARWEPDFAATDAWSTRIVGVWWFARVIICIVSTLLMGGTLAWTASSLNHKSFPMLALCAMGPTAWSCYNDLRKAKADLLATNVSGQAAVAAPP